MVVSAVAEAIEAFNINQTKADLLIKYILRRYRMGKAQRASVYEAFYFYLRHKEMTEFLSENASLEEIARTALTLSTESLLGLPVKQQELWDDLSPATRQKYWHSLPAFWNSELVEAFGERAYEIADYLNSRAGVTLFTLLRRNSREFLLKNFEINGIKAMPGKLSPAAVFMQDRVPRETDLFFNIQDESSQLTTLLINAAHNDCLDLCAGHGGKSVGIGTFFPHIKLSASDIRERLANHTLRRAAEAGVSLKWINRSDIRKKYATVFVDAPCSGSGVWRRNPEDRYRINATDIEKLAAAQRTLLLSAGNLVADGGELIYVTCSFSRKENEETIEWFLNKVSSFTLINAGERLKTNLRNYTEEASSMILRYFYETPYLRTRPELGGDLFFAAVLKRK
jgi:16S rRNA C967 or C1407 C5-methylase (RsmB/RsmF family)